jgi:hypothetical protein
VHLDAAEAVDLDGAADQRPDPPGVALRVDGAEPDQARCEGPHDPASRSLAAG